MLLTTRLGGQVDYEHDHRLERIITLLKDLDAKLGVCVAESDLWHFEQRHGVRLPECYRAFLSRVGNGGAGPGYGLDRFDSDAVVEQLARTFPLTTAWVWDADPAADEARIDACQGGWLKIGTEGCGMDWALIVTGVERGQVWNVEAQGAQPCAPARDFLDWYLLWLEWKRTGAGTSGPSWWDTIWADFATR
jgi:hypothetical protein